MGHTIEFKLLTHSFTRSLQKLHTRITILLSSFEERKYFSKDIYFLPKKVNRSTPLNNCFTSFLLLISLKTSQIIDFDDR
jgi:hypothetical protein